MYTVSICVICVPFDNQPQNPLKSEIFRQTEKVAQHPRPATHPLSSDFSLFFHWGRGGRFVLWELFSARKANGVCEAITIHPPSPYNSLIFHCFSAIRQKHAHTAPKGRTHIMIFTDATHTAAKERGKLGWYNGANFDLW